MKRSSPIRMRMALLLTAVATLAAQVPAARLTSSAGETSLPARQAAEQLTTQLLARAHALEVQGRMDVAMQTWEQVLLAEPDNVEALAGMVRASRLSGRSADAQHFLERLQQVDPHDPYLTRGLPAAPPAAVTATLAQAGRLSASGQSDRALALLRQVYGDTPPPGEAALVYYQAAAVMEDGRPHAIAGLRALADRFPQDPRYAIALGKILTYNPRTRGEGRGMLQRYPDDASAMEALRQSLVWDAQKPATAGDIRAYLARHAAPQADRRPARHSGQQLGGPLEPDRSNAAARRGSLTGTLPAQGKRASQPAAVRPLQLSDTMRTEDLAVQRAPTDSRFDQALQQATTALNANDLRGAEAAYRAALAIRPGDPTALDGLGGALMRAGLPEAAAAVFATCVQVAPADADAWSGLVKAQSSAGDDRAGAYAEALATDQREPAAVHASLMRNPGYLLALTAAYRGAGREGDAGRVLAAALQLPFPASGSGVAPGVMLQDAALLAAAGRYGQATALYRRVLAVDPGNLTASIGVVQSEHLAGDDRAALAEVQAMSPQTFRAASDRPEFVTTLAAIDERTGSDDKARAVLEALLAQQRGAGRQPSTPAQLQLAGIEMRLGQQAAAYALYRAVLTHSPGSAAAWLGWLRALEAGGHDAEALAEVQQIPWDVRPQLEADPVYLQAVGAMHVSVGQPQLAVPLYALARQMYAIRRERVPPALEIETAWLLYGTRDNAGLYQQLLYLGSRADLTDAERRTVQTIWSRWAVRRADALARGGDRQAALAILNAAAQAFAGNADVIRDVSGGYVAEGHARQAVALFKAANLANASAADLEAAIDAALAAREFASAETWLHDGLQRYPRDPQMLILAGKFEQARGNASRAADDYRAALALLPAPDAGARLAEELSRPAPPQRGAKHAEGPPGDLRSLLAPVTGGRADAGTRNSARGAAAQPAPGRPYLPTYPDSGVVGPIILGSPAGSAAPVGPAGDPPATGGHPAVSEPLGNDRPQARLADPRQPPALHLHVSAATLALLRPYLHAEPAASRGMVAASALPPHTSPFEPEATVPRWSPAAYHPQAAPQPMAPCGMSCSYGQQQYPPPTRARPTGQAAAAATQDALKREMARSHIRQTARSRAHQKVHSQALRRKSMVRVHAPLSAMPPAIRSSTQPMGEVTVTGTLGTYGVPASPAKQERGSAAALQTFATAPAATTAYPALSNEPPDQPMAPPLRGYYDSRFEGIAPPSPRQQTELALAELEGSYSPWAGSSVVARYRSGTPGLDRLVTLEVPLEATVTVGKAVRLSVVPMPIFLSSGVLPVIGGSLGTQAVLGTLAGNASSVPAQQFASGVGGELQVTTRTAAAAVGYTPAGFLVANVIGRAQYTPLGGHFTVSGGRDAVRETQLSYAGLRDPGSATPTFGGNVWGGVVLTGGAVRFDAGDDRAGVFASGEAGVLTGNHVLRNQKYGGTLGMNLRVVNAPQVGSLTVGASVLGEHFTANERGETYGLGGYFSPDLYLLAVVPVAMNGHHGRNLHYAVNGAAGAKTYQEEAQRLFPLNPGLQSTATAACSRAQVTAGSCAQTPASSHTSLDLSVDARASYRLTDHVFLGSFFTANNTNGYRSVSGGFFARFLLKPQSIAAESSPDLFPVEGLRPLRVP